MKTKLTQLFFYVNTIDRRYIEAAYFVFMLAMFFMRISPEDGSSGTRKI